MTYSCCKTQQKCQPVLCRILWNVSETSPSLTGLRTSCFCGYNIFKLCWCTSLSIIIGIINKYPNPLFTCESLKAKALSFGSLYLYLSECFCTKRVHCVGNIVWWRREAASFGIQTTWMWTKALPLVRCVPVGKLYNLIDSISSYLT